MAILLTTDDMRREVFLKAEQAKIQREETGVSVISLDVTENGDYTAPDGFAYSPVSVNVSGAETAHTVELTSDGVTISAATDVFAADAPQSGTYVYILTNPAIGHPFFSTSGARFVMAIFVNGTLKGNVGYRSLANGTVSAYSPTVLANSYSGDKFTRIEVD